MLQTYELGFDKYSVLPLLGGYLIIYFQATGILTATLHEAQLDITGADEDQRIQVTETFCTERCF